VVFAKIGLFQVHVLQLMNDRLSTGFTEQEILSIFCDICEGKLLLYLTESDESYIIKFLF
jgi:hypothetical protein